MNMKFRPFPPAGTVTSIPIGNGIYAYVILFRRYTFWLYNFVTKGRAFDSSLFPSGRWKKLFRNPSAGLTEHAIDECHIHLSDEELTIPPTWEKVAAWKMERGEVPTPYRVQTSDPSVEHEVWYVTEDQLPQYQENVAFTHKELVAYIKANLDQFEIITAREDQLSSPPEALPEVATFTPGCIYEIWLSGLDLMELTDLEEIGEEIDEELEKHDAGEVIGMGGTDGQDHHNIAVQSEPGKDKQALTCIRRVLQRLKANPETTDISIQGGSSKNLGLK